MHNFNKLFRQFVSNHPEFQEAADVIRQNSQGNFWLIGGFIYRGIAHKAYGSQLPEVDLDFLVESPKKEITLPRNWSVANNRYGNLKFLGPKYSIDFVPLDNVHAIKSQNLEPRLDNFLPHVPLTVQAIVYDCVGGYLTEDVGMSALTRKEVTINNNQSAEYAAMKKGLSLHEMIRKKAMELDFQPIYPN